MFFFSCSQVQYAFFEWFDGILWYLLDIVVPGLYFCRPKHDNQNMNWFPCVFHFCENKATVLDYQSIMTKIKSLVSLLPGSSERRSEISWYHVAFISLQYHAIVRGQKIYALLSFLFTSYATQNIRLVSIS